MADAPLAPEGVIPGLSAETSARLLAALTAEPAVQDIWLYGSRAMGRHHPGSDIDLTQVGLRLHPASPTTAPPALSPSPAAP